MQFKIEQDDVQDQIDLSPLIDMVFILLIFFMVTTTFVKDMQVDLERPGASSAQMSSEKSLRVTIDQDKKIYFNSSEVELWAVQGLVRDALKSKSSKDILVIADLNVSTKDLVDLIDELKLAGAGSVGVATQNEG